MKLLNIAVQQKRLTITAILVFAFSLILLVFVILLNFYFYTKLPSSYGMSLQRIILYSINTLSYQNQSVVLMYSLYAFHFKLKRLGDYLEKLDKNQKQWDVELLKRLSILIDEFCGGLESVKICFTITFVVNILHYTFVSIFTIYGVMTYLLKAQPTFVEWMYCLQSITFQIYSTPFTFWVILVGSCMKHHGKRLEVLAQKLLYKNFANKKVYRRAELIFMQLQHRRPVVACGLFSIDWKLLFFLLGLCYSYLVIITQFEINEF